MTQQYSTADQFFTGTGILVQGDPFRINTTGFDGKPLKDDRKEWFCAVAFPKDQPAATRFNELYAVMQQEAQKHPYAAQAQQMNWVGFHWKVEDGDAPQNVNKPGWKGCYVVKFKNGFQPQVFDENGAVIPSPYTDVWSPDGKSVTQTLSRAHTLPCGHYVRVMCSISNNKSAPPQYGIYANFHMIQRVGYGPVIQSGPDYSTAMQTQAAPQLAGMQSMPVAGAMPSMPQQQQPQVGGMPGAAPQMPGMPGQAPQAPQMGGIIGQAPQAPQMGGIIGQAPQAPQMGGMPGQAPQAPQMGGIIGQAPQAPQMGGIIGQAPQQPMGGQPGMPGMAPQAPQVPGMPQQPMGGQPGMPGMAPQQQFAQQPQPQFAPQPGQHPYVQ